jgi:hypothetical protein
MMNKDNLEKFIIERRDAFDDKEPPVMAWQKIQKELRKDNKVPRRISLWNLTRIAAAVVFLIGFGIVIGRQSSMSSEVAVVEENFPEFLEAKSYYETEVDEKLAQLASYNYDASIQEDMSQLDSFMEELRTALEEAPKGSEERIINAMISNYQTKLDILERVLEAAKSNNQLKEKSKDDEVNI